MNVEATPDVVEACLEELGLCFCYAPVAHPAMRRVAAVRKRLARRTIFNVLGPLANPARADRQVLGAGRPELRPLLAGALARMHELGDGVSRALVVHGEDGMGDVTIAGRTEVTEVAAGVANAFAWTPEDFGLERSGTTGLEVESPAHSAAVVRKVLKGAPGAARDVVVLNAAAALYVADLADTPRAAASRCCEAIDSGAAADLLARLADRSHGR